MKNERKEELKDEMKNRISLALKDPILQQGFEIICKENAELKEKKIKGCYFGKDELGNDFFAKCDCVDCQKRTIALLDLRKEYLNKINKEKTINEQLTKAKEIISEWEDSFCCGADYLYLGNKGKELRIKSQKFLNSEVEK